MIISPLARFDVQGKEDFAEDGGWVRFEEASAQLVALVALVRQWRRAYCDDRDDYPALDDCVRRTERVLGDRHPAFEHSYNLELPAEAPDLEALDAARLNHLYRRFVTRLHEVRAGHALPGPWLRDFEEEFDLEVARSDPEEKPSE